MSSIAISTEHLSCGYDSKNPIVYDVNLKIYSGEFSVITGPNGSGKTTLFKTLTKLIKPLSGNFEISDSNKLSLVPQSKMMNLNYPLLVKDVIELPLKAKNTFRNNDRDPHFENEIIDKMNLKSLMNKPLKECSGGQLQRVLITRSFIQKPKILFLDEPMDALDKESLFLLNRMLHDYTHEGNTIIVITHHIPEIMKNLFTSRFLVENGMVSEV
jgi:manganese/zinc/iron transport system ATP- binding protein